MILAIEMGTSRTRVRLVDENGTMNAETIQGLGARDVAIEGNNAGLKAAIHAMIDDLLKKKNLTDGEIEDVVAHGMVTADIGLYKVEHAPAPVHIEKLARHALRVYIPEIIDKPILLIPGVKNDVQDVQIKNLNSVDFMRGEETQIMGMLSSTYINDRTSLPFYFLMLSSFTKLVLVNEYGQIDKACTNVTGQLFPAIMKETFLAGMLPDSFPEPSTMNKGLLLEGVRFAESVGFPRALMLIRLSQYFLKMSKEDAMSFLEGMLAYLDLSKMSQKLIVSEKLDLVIAGDQYRREVYSLLLKEHYGFRGNIVSVNDEEMKRITITGALRVLKQVRANEDSQGGEYETGSFGD